MGVRAVRPSMALSISNIYILKYGGPPADGGHPGGRRTGGHPGGRRTGGNPSGQRAVDRRALHYGWAYILTLWGKGGYGGIPNVKAGKMYQHSTAISPVGSIDATRFVFVFHLPLPVLLSLANNHVRLLFVRSTIYYTVMLDIIWSCTLWHAGLYSTMLNKCRRTVKYMTIYQV
jgi:hypothetical protein